MINIDIAIKIISISILTIIISIVLTKYMIKIFRKYNVYGEDIFKLNRPKIPKNIGLSFIISIIIATTLLSASNILSWNITTAITTAMIITAIIGLIDEHLDPPGYFKPLAMLAAGIPIIILKCYTPYIRIILFGGFNIPILYPIFILIAMSVTSNMVNMLDVINGSAVWGAMISTIAGLIAGIIINSESAVVIAITILASIIGPALYNTYPAKGFLGNAGSLALGTSIGILAIIGRIEVPMVIATLPFIHNSFYFLTYAKSFIEHKKLNVQITRLNQRGEIEDAKNRNAPITLLRLLVAQKPLTEKEALKQIVTLFIITGILSIITAILIKVRI